MSLSEDDKKAMKEVVIEVLNSRRKARQDFRNAARRTNRDDATRSSQDTVVAAKGADKQCVHQSK